MAVTNAERQRAYRQRRLVIKTDTPAPAILVLIDELFAARHLSSTARMRLREAVLAGTRPET